MSGGQARRWGFHRLEPEWAQRIVDAAGVRSHHLVIDLGAGTGVLTEALLGQGARVIAVELHTGRAERLRDSVAGRPCSVLTMDLNDFRYPGRPVRVVANPPFATSAALLRALVRAPQVRAADLVLPRWLVERYVTSTHRRHGFDAAYGMALPPAAFRPYAPHPCAVLRLRRRHR